MSEYTTRTAARDISVSADWGNPQAQVFGGENGALIQHGRTVADYRHKMEAALRYELEMFYAYDEDADVEIEDALSRAHEV